MGKSDLCVPRGLFAGRKEARLGLRPMSSVGKNPWHRYDGTGNVRDREGV